MDYRAVTVAGRRSPEAVVDAVVSALQEVVVARDLPELVAITDVSGTRLETIREGENPGLSMQEVATVLGAREDGPGASVIRADFRDTLVVWMSEAVVDVDRVAAALDDTDAETLRAKIEGDQPFPLVEYAAVVAFVETSRD